VGDIDPGAKTVYLPQVKLQNCDDILMAGLAINSVAPGVFDTAYEGEANLQVQGCRDVVLSALDLLGAGGDGMTLGA